MGETSVGAAAVAAKGLNKAIKRAVRGTDRANGTVAGITWASL
jgi:hypothetical protein